MLKHFPAQCFQHTITGTDFMPFIFSSSSAGAVQVLTVPLPRDGLTSGGLHRLVGTGPPPPLCIGLGSAASRKTPLPRNSEVPARGKRSKQSSMKEMKSVTVPSQTSPRGNYMVKALIPRRGTFLASRPGRWFGSRIMSRYGSS